MHFFECSKSVTTSQGTEMFMQQKHPVTLVNDYANYTANEHRTVLEDTLTYYTTFCSIFCINLIGQQRLYFGANSTSLEKGCKH